MNSYLINALITFGISFVFLLIDMVFIQTIPAWKIWFIVGLVFGILWLILRISRLFDENK